MQLPWICECDDITLNSMPDNTLSFHVKHNGIVCVCVCVQVSLTWRTARAHEDFEARALRNVVSGLDHQIVHNL